MSGQFSHYGRFNDNNSEKQKKFIPKSVEASAGNNQRDKDADLIIDENTIYEIDRECFERMKRQKRR